MSFPIPVGDKINFAPLQMGSATPAKGLPITFDEEEQFRPKWKRKGKIVKRFRPRRDRT